MPKIPRATSAELLHRDGDIVASLGGSFMTSSDVGTGESDMDGPWTDRACLRPQRGERWGRRSGAVYRRRCLPRDQGEPRACPRIRRSIGQEGARSGCRQRGAARRSCSAAMALWCSSRASSGASGRSPRRGRFRGRGGTRNCAKCDSMRPALSARRWRGEHFAAPLPHRCRICEQPACTTGGSSSSPRRRDPLRAGLRHQCRWCDCDQLPRVQRAESGRRGRGAVRIGDTLRAIYVQAERRASDRRGGGCASRCAIE